MNLLDLPADQALFSEKLPEKLEGVIATYYENERPLQGLAGLLDWRFQGLISSYVRNGFMTGKLGEFTYVPAQKNNRLYHLFFIGCGSGEKSIKKQPPYEVFQPLKKNLAQLKLTKVGISKSDFGNAPITKNLSGVPLWIVQ